MKYLALIVVTVIALTTASEGTLNYSTQGADWTMGSCETNNKEQSPIDIVVTAGAMHNLVGEVKFSKTTLAVTQTNTGTAIKLALGKDDESYSATLGVANGTNQTYYASQFHFHSPSEHEVNGQQYDLVIHTVMYTKAKDTKRYAAVLQFFFREDVNAPNMPWLTQINGNIGDTTKTTEYDFDFESFYKYVPAISDFWHYEGGLTTPTCDEVVNWYLNMNILKVNTVQLAVMKALWQNTTFDPTPGQGNNRLTQPLDGRIIHTGQYSVSMSTPDDGKTFQYGPFIGYGLAVLVIIGLTICLCMMMKRNKELECSVKEMDITMLEDIEKTHN